MNNIIYIGGGYSQLPYITAINDLGIFSIVTDQNNNAPARKIANRFINLSKFEGEKIATELVKLPGIQPETENLIMTNSGGRTCLSVALMGKMTGIGTYSENAALCACSKLKFKESFLGMSAVSGYRLRNEFEGINVNQEFNLADVSRKWPAGMFIKPDISDKSKVGGVYGREGFDLEAIIDNCPNKTLVLEEYIPEGRDLIVPVLVRNDRIFLRGRILEEMNFVSSGIERQGFTILREEEKELYKALMELSDKYILRTGIINAPVALSYRISGKDIIPVELHLDLGGENIYEFSLGLNTISLMDAFINEGFDQTGPVDKYTLMLYDQSFENLGDVLVNKQIEHEILLASSRRKQYLVNAEMHELEEIIGQQP